MLSRHLRLYLVSVLAAGLLMTYQSSRGPLRPFMLFSLTLNSISSTITMAGNSVKKAVRAFRGSEKELMRLRAEVRNLRIRLMDRDELLQENSRLREMLAFKISEPRQVSIATVISRAALRWSNSMMIDKGSRDGVEKDMVVITPDGLVGKVTEARPYYSVVLLITDSRFSAAVRLQRSREEAVLSGDGAGGCVLRFLSSDAEVGEDDMLVTSGLDALFPHGIPAGTISSVDTRPKALFHTVEVEPLARLDKLEEVIVVER
jgi:rod shape-determining protein MreC